MKYCVTVVRYGCLFVEAGSPEEAMDIADHQTTDTVSCPTIGDRLTQTRMTVLMKTAISQKGRGTDDL